MNGYQHCRAHAIAIESYPNTEAKARQHSRGNIALYNQLVAQAKAWINPGFRFYQQKFSVQFLNIVRAFKAARLCCPVQVQALRPTAASVQKLKQFSFITDAQVVQLVEELPNYLAIADGAVVETEQGTVVGYTCCCSPKLVCCSKEDLVGSA